MYKNILYILILESIVVTCILLWLKPDESGSIVIVLTVIPLVFVINLVIALIFLFINKKYSLVFLVMSFCSIMIVIFQSRIMLYCQNYKSYKSYKFNFDSKLYELTISKSDTHYSILDITTKGIGIGIYTGEYFTQKDTIFLSNKNIAYKSDVGPFIFEDKLYNFLDEKDVINLE